jgi:mono/diheme cytochrome c family protein
MASHLPAATAAAIAVLFSLTPAVAETPLERGEYIVRGIGSCGNCHTPLDANAQPIMDQELSGRLAEDGESFTAYAANLTPAGPLGKWSDDDIKKALRDGVRPDGSIIGPPMPIEMYRGLSDDDLTAIVTFLRSLKPVQNDVPKSVYRIPLPKSYGPPVASVTAPPRGVTAEYGKYIAGPLTHCMDCHTPLGPDGKLLLDTDAGRGGREFQGPWGYSYSANITPHTDGIADVTDDQLKEMITKGVRPGGIAMLPPMPYAWLAKFTPDDLNAVVVYLRSLPPLPSN